MHFCICNNPFSVGLSSGLPQWGKGDREAVDEVCRLKRSGGRSKPLPYRYLKYRLFPIYQKHSFHFAASEHHFATAHGSCTPGNREAVDEVCHLNKSAGG